MGSRFNATLLSTAQSVVVVPQAISSIHNLAAKGGDWRTPDIILASKSTPAPTETNHVTVVVSEPLLTAIRMESKGKTRATEPSATSTGHFSASGIATRTAR